MPDRNVTMYNKTLGKKLTSFPNSMSNIVFTHSPATIFINTLSRVINSLCSVINNYRQDIYSHGVFIDSRG